MHWSTGNLQKPSVDPYGSVPLYSVIICPNIANAIGPDVRLKILVEQL